MNRPSRLLIPNSLSRTPTHPTRSFSLFCPIPFPFLSPSPLFSSSSSLYFPLSHSSNLTSLSLSIATTFPAKFSTMENPPGPQPDRYPNQSQPEDFVHIEDPDPVLSESFIDVEVEEEGEAEAVPRDGGGTDGGTENDSDQSQRSGVIVESEFQLPEEISRSVMTLTCPSSTEGGTCHVYLVGTAHVSQESCREVEAVVSYVKPEAVFLELCASRVAVLTPQNLKIPTVGEMVEMWKKNHNTFGILYSYFLAKVASKLEVFPGSEFRVAYEEAMKYGGTVVLGDRPVQITLQRTWSMMPLWHKMKLVYSLLFQAFFLPSTEDLNKMLKEMDDVDMLTLVIQQMSKEFPTLMDTLVHERDQYMSSMLLRLASERKTVVAVVGKGHLQGIRNHWQQPVVMRDLLEVPSTKQSVSILKILTSAGAVVAGVAIISGIYYGCRK